MPITKSFVPLIAALMLPSRASETASTLRRAFSWDNAPIKQMFGDWARLLDDAAQIVTRLHAMVVAKRLQAGKFAIRTAKGLHHPDEHTTLQRPSRNASC